MCICTASLVESLQLSGATSCTASFSSAPGSPDVELRIFRRLESGSVNIDMGRLQKQMRGAFQLLRDRGQHVHSVHIAADPSTAAAAGSPPHLSFAYLDAAGMTLTVDDADIEVMRMTSCLVNSLACLAMVNGQLGTGTPLWACVPQARAS